ncbi:hypothetical protein Q8Z05_21410 [Arthrobacter oryzae]|nr:hypothetical protein [Arthrobacter oryzae]WLQ08817.1 hypothetical protein Q8Z05_21410 [Arthrobacter oryzae]
MSDAVVPRSISNVQRIAAANTNTTPCSVNLSDFSEAVNRRARATVPPDRSVLKINQLKTITDDVIEAAASILVIGN